MNGFQMGDVVSILTPWAILTELACGFALGWYLLSQMKDGKKAVYLANLVALPFFLSMMFEQSFETDQWERWIGIMILRFPIYGLSCMAGRYLAVSRTERAEREAHEEADRLSRELHRRSEERVDRYRRMAGAG